MTKRDLIALEEWDRDDVEGLLDLAARVKRGEVRGGLEGRLLAAVFLDPSLRTRASMEAAMFLHGGHAIVLEPGKGSWAWETEAGVVMDGANVEHIVEAARVLGRYADVVGLRSFPRGGAWAEARRDAIVRRFAAHCEKPVVNLESARRHPCQELADAMTLREKLGDPRGRRFVLSWTWHPKQLPTAVPASAVLAAARNGMEVVIARPEGYDLDPDDLAAVRALAAETGGAVQVTDDLDGALRGAAAVYPKSWGALDLFGDPAADQERRAALRDWRMTAARLRPMDHGVVLHCLPVRRNVEIDDAVLDSPASAVVDEAENRLHVQRALLLTLLGAA
ncbi:MAG TPA: N-acetylornithine carbamoyltransferase [Gemmatimonadales bacterium]|nr:N-acetylornithine carbamoyltransferase [Gemmatimonadales bacterium]